MDWSSYAIVHQKNCLLRQSDTFVQTPEESKLPWADSTLYRKGEINLCKGIFGPTSLCGAADPEWKAIEATDAHSGSEKAHSTLGLVPKSSNNYETKTDEINCFFWSYESLAFTCICSTAPTMAKLISFKIPTLPSPHFFFFSCINARKFLFSLNLYLLETLLIKQIPKHLK